MIRKPFQLICETKNLTSEKEGEGFLKVHSFQRLPTAISNIFFISNDDLDKLATMADKM